MKEELTREVLEAMKKCEYPRCVFCELPKDRKCKTIKKEIRKLATALLEEMDKPNVGVWKDAPKWATSARVRWSNPNYPVGKDELYSETYTRELPKTRARQIAEEISDELNNAPRYKTEIEIIESALNKYADEITWKK